VNAVISGRARIALVQDGDQFFSIDADKPEQTTPRQRWEYRFLFNGVVDLDFVEDVDRTEVVRRLTAAARRERALHFALVLIDGAWTTERRRSAAADLESLLSESEAELRDYIQNVLYSLPLPAPAAVQSALLLAPGERTRDLLGSLVRAQNDIREMRKAWEAAIQAQIENPEDRAFARARAVRAGLFRLVVAFRGRAAKLENILQRASASDLADVPGLQALVSRWVSPVQEQWATMEQIVATYWGHVRQMRSSFAHVDRILNFPSLAWPPRTEPDSAVHHATVSESVVESFNEAMSASAKKLRRNRRLARLLRLSPVHVAIIVITGLIAWKVVVVVATIIQFVVLVGGAAAVFWLLHRAVGSSATWLNALRDQQELQARREEFELAWALSLSPLNLPKSLGTTGDAAEAIRDRLLSQITEPPSNRVSPLEELRTAVGGVRIVIRDIQEIAERSFVLQVGPHSTPYTGTNSVALTLIAGTYDIALKARTRDGEAIERRIVAVVKQDQVREVDVAFVMA
jgi:hypothetical protein